MVPAFSGKDGTEATTMGVRLWAGAVLAAVWAAVPPAAAEEPIRIGVILPQSGVYASLGSEIVQGLELGFETFGSVFGGRAVELIAEDSEVKPAVGLSKARKLILQDRVDMLVGPVASNVANALRDYVHRAEVPLIVPNAGNDLLTGENCSPWVLRTSFSNGQIVRGMGPWLYGRGFRRIYLVAADYAAGRQMMEAFRGPWLAAGGAVVGESYAPLRETRDFGPWLARIRAAAPDAVFAFFAGSQAIQFVTQYDAFGLKDEIALTGAGFLVSPLYVDAQGPAADGVLGILNYLPGIDNDANRAFQAAYRARHGRVASEYAVQGYDTAHLIAEALAATGGATDDRAALVAAMRGAAFDGPRGPLRIDSATHNIVQDIHIFETRVAAGGVEFVPVDRLPAMQDPPNGCVLG